MASISDYGIDRKEAVEQNYWATSKTESPDADPFACVLMKIGEARVFAEKLDRFNEVFRSASRVLELGGGQCWASCIVKKRFPHLHVTGSDIAASAIASVQNWERIFGSQIDKTVACRSYNTPFQDGEFDLIFVYSAAHHFGKHRKTFQEIARILRPGGTALYLHEPTCTALMHPMAFRRVNKISPDIPEDVLRGAEVCAIAREMGLQAQMQPAPTTTNRGPKQLIYYYILGLMPILQRVLPVSADFVFTRL